MSDNKDKKVFTAPIIVDPGATASRLNSLQPSSLEENMLMMETAENHAAARALSRLAAARESRDGSEAKLECVINGVMGPHLKRKKTSNASSKQVQKRSWKQADLNKEIENEIIKFSETINNARQGSSGAIKAVKKMFSRNEFARRLGAQGKMVSKSLAWQKLAAEMGLPRRSHAIQGRLEQIGLDIALEKIGNDSTNDEIIRKETLDLIEKMKQTNKTKANHDILDVLKDDLIMGKRTDDNVREILELNKKQLIDDHKKKEFTPL